MTPEVVHERAAHVAGVRADPSAGTAAIIAALTDARRLRAWIDAQEAALVQRLTSVDSVPQATIADTSRGSSSQANRTSERASTLTASPALAAALGGGAITAGHVDAVTRAAKSIESDRHDELFERIDALADVASAATDQQFADRVRLEVKRLQADGGEERLMRQRRHVRARSWVDHDGMWNLRGRFDPVSGARLASALERTTNVLFAERTPDLCPSDPIEKQQFLGAYALASCLDSSIAATGSERQRSTCLIVIDADSPVQPGPVAQWSVPIEVPPRVIAELADEADQQHTVVVHNGVVLHAPGLLDLGRTSRLANRDQRRALRGLDRHCAIPGWPRRVRPLQAPPHHLVALRRRDQPRQPPARLCHAPLEDPPRRLGRRARIQSPAHTPPSRRLDPQHGPAHHPSRLIGEVTAP